MRTFYYTKFLDDGTTIELISFGAIAEEVTPPAAAARRTRRLTGNAREETGQLVCRMASAGMSDPDIAQRLQLTAHQVASLRREGAVPAGEQRWRPQR